MPRPSFNLNEIVKKLSFEIEFLGYLSDSEFGVIQMIMTAMLLII